MIASWSFWLGAATVLVVAAVFLRYRRLSSIPGPFLASLTDFWRFSAMQTGRFPETLRNLHIQLGPFVRIGPNTVSIADPAAIPVVHSMHGEFKKADSYSTMRALVNGKILGTVVDIQNEDEVSALKRVVGSAFATKNLLDYEPDVDHTLDVLVQAIRQRRTVSMLDTMQQFQVDFLMKAAFSNSTDYLPADRSTAPISTEPRLRHWARWQSMPALERLLFQSPFCSAWYKKQSKNPPVWTAMAMNEFNKRKNPKAAEAIGVGGGKPDLLTKFLFTGDRHKETVTDAMMLKMVSSTISAGFDTSAYSMTVIIYFLLKHPEVMKKLRAEIDDSLNAGQLSDPPRFVETDKLKYLGAAIREAVRLQPFLHLLLEREVPAGGAEIAGKFLPGGTTVGISTGNVHRDATIYGKDADEFRPERWLEADPRRKQLMERSILSFGAGKRICLGRHIAELEMKKVIPRLLLQFDMSLKDPNYVLEPRDKLSNFPKTFFVVFQDRA